MLLNTKQEEVQKAKENLFQNTQNPWDPINDFNLDQTKQNAAEIEAKFEKLQKQPNKIKFHYLIATFFFIISIAIGIVISFIYSEFIPLIVSAVIGFLPLGIIISIYKKLGIDLVKLQIAKENKWLYDPKKSTRRWRNLRHYFPEIFNKGNKDQFVEDQYWGEMNNTNFYSGLFTFSIETGHGKNRNKKTYHRNFFAMKLKKPLNCRFSLYPENTFSKIGNFFTKKEINTESIEFNKQFAFSYNGSKGEKAQEIVKTLSPAVQQKLLDLDKRKGDFTVLFVQDIVIFLFEGKLLENPKTNFKKSLKVAREDKEVVSEQINELINLGEDISQYLD